MRIWFGVANVFVNPTGGNVPTISAPQQLFTLQDFSIDIDATVKELRGQSQYPDDTAFSDRKITFKSGMGRHDIDAFNQIVFGESAIATGGFPLSVNEAGTIPATGPYTITVAQAIKTPLQDEGVYFTSGANAGQKLLKVNSITASGQYTFNAGTGVFTFSPADTGLGVAMSYNYTVTTGRNLIVQNHTQGFGPSLEIFASNPYQLLTAGVPNYVHCYAAKITKTGLPAKRADYVIVPLEGECYANASGQVVQFYED